MDKTDQVSNDCKFRDLYEIKTVEDIPFSFHSDDVEVLQEFYIIVIKILDEAGETARASICREKLQELEKV